MRKLSLLLILLAISFAGRSQGTELKGNMFAGSSLMLQFGTVTNIRMSPFTGYHINDYLSAGLGFTYHFYNNRNYYPTYRLSVLGGSAFFRVHPVDFLYIQGKYEILTYKSSDFSPTGAIENVVSEGLLGGIGYREDLSDNLHYFIQLMYDFNYSIFTPYGSPLIYEIGLEVAFPVSKNAR